MSDVVSTVNVTGPTQIQKYNPPVTDDGLDLDDVCAGHLTAQRELAELRAQLAQPMAHKTCQICILFEDCKIIQSASDERVKTFYCADWTPR